MAKHRRRGRGPGWEIRQNDPDGDLEMWWDGRPHPYTPIDVDDALAEVSRSLHPDDRVVHRHPDGYIEPLTR